LGCWLPSRLFAHVLRMSLNGCTCRECVMSSVRKSDEMRVSAECQCSLFQVRYVTEMALQ
jgi:hypothetical protein